MQGCDPKINDRTAAVLSDDAVSVNADLLRQQGCTLGMATDHGSAMPMVASGQPH